ncbi:MAG: phosphotransferase [Saprospiraceae bacterium]|nr:phosphotransferase [Saprospiraceae bacterium]
MLQWQIEIKLPKRVTHNDTKLNNMLFDDLGKGICMVDLDTMMSGEIILILVMCCGRCAILQVKRQNGPGRI